MSATVGTAYVDIKPDWASLNRDVAKHGPVAAKAFSNQFGKALGPVMSQQAKHIESAWRGVKIGAVAGGAAAAYAFKDVVEKGAAFEKQMSVNAAVSEAKRKQLVKLEKQAIQLGKATFYSAGEAAEAQSELIKGGLALQKVIGGGLPAALNLAEAGQLGLTTAAETTVNAMKLFGLSGKEAGSVADMLATAANRTTADVEDFAMALKQGGSVTKLAGYDMNQTVTILEALAEAGIKNADAGTSMKTAVIHLLKPSEKQAKLMKELGIEVVAQNGHLKDAAGLSEELAKATEGMTKAERAKVFATIGGTDGIRTLNALYEAGAEKLRGLEKANEKQGTAQQVAAKKMDNLAGEIEQFKGSVETAEISIYKGMAPALKELAGEATFAANKVGAIFENESLSGSQKIEKSFGLIDHELGRLWDENDMTDHLVDLLDKAVPVIAEHAGQLGLEAAKGFVHGFTNADLLGKAVMATWLINFIGGKQAFVGIGKMYGRRLGLSLGEEAAKTAAPVIAAGTAVAAKAASATVATAIAKAPTPASLAALGGFSPISAAGQRIQKDAAWSYSRIASSRGEAFGAATLDQMMGGFSLASAGSMAQFAKAEQAQVGRFKAMGARLGNVAGSIANVELASRLKTATPEIRATLAGMGPRVASGLTTWGLGGLVVGELTKEIVGGKAGDDLGTALQGAGLGAAIGSAIPGLGTAVGAAIGAGISSVLASNPDSWGDEMALEFIARFQHHLPEIKKMIDRMELGSAGHFEKVYGEIAGVKVTAKERRGTTGLRGVRAEAKEELKALEGEGASDKTLDLIRQKIALISQTISQGTKEIHTYSHGFDLLKSGVTTRMGDISKITQENIAHINQVWKNNPPKWHQAMAESMRASIAAIRSGMKEGVISTEAGQKRIQFLTRNLRLFQGSDPLGLAKGFSENWQKAGRINEQAINQEIGQLKKMPKGARESAREAMVQMAKTMESEGKLVKGSAARLNSALTTKFGQTNKQIQQGTAKSMAHIAQSVAEGATNVGGALSNIFDNLANALAAVGDSKIPTFSLSTLSTASQYHHAREATQSGFGGPPAKRQRGGSIPGTFIVPGAGSGDIFRTVIPAGSFIENREAVRRLPFQGGGMVPVALEPGERAWLPHAVAGMGLGHLEARNAAVPRFQQGGLAHPLLRGPEPVRSLGQDVTDRAYRAAQTYYRKHAEPERVLRMLHAGEAITSKGFPYVYGGGHGGFAIQPVDCSGLVSYILHAGNFIDAPMSVQQGSGLYTLGKAGPGKWFTWGVRGTSGANAHTMISVKGPGGKPKFFESGGSGGGAHQTGGWDGSFQFRHMPGFQKGGQVGMPDKAREVIAKYGQKAFDPHDSHFVGWGYQRGGSIPALQRFAKGGWVKTGYTIYSGAGGGAGGDLQKGHGYAELGTATEGGQATGHGYIAQALGRGGELPMEYPLDVKVGEKVAKLYKRDRGYGQGTPAYSIDIHQLAWPELGLSTANGKGTAFIRPAGSSSDNAASDEHSFKEDVPSTFHGLQTGSLHFPSVPNNIKGVEREIDRWTTERKRYGTAIRAAQKANRPGVQRALEHNRTDIENHLRDLRNERVKLRREEAKKRFSKKLAKRFAKLTGLETTIEAAQRIYEKRSQDAEQIVDLEPLQPEVTPKAKGESDKAYEDRGVAAEKAYVKTFSDYVNTQERPAYQSVLQSEADWRNSILGAQSVAAGNWQKQNFLGGMEGNFESRIVALVQNEQMIQAFAENARQQIEDWKSAHPKAKGLPDALKNLRDQREKALEKLPFLKFKEGELRKTLGEARGFFYPGLAGGGVQGAEKIFHLLSNPQVPLPGSGSFEEALKDVQGIHWPDQHEHLDSLPGTRAAGKFGGAIWETQSLIEELGLKVSQVASSISEPDSSEPEDNSARLQALEEIALAGNQEKLVRQIESKVFGDRDRYGFRLGGLLYPAALPKYHTGGVIRPTAPGQREVPIMAKPDERIRTPEQELEMAEAIRGLNGSQPGRPHVEVNINERTGEVKVKVDDREIEDVVNRMQQRAARSAGRPRAVVAR